MRVLVVGTSGSGKSTFAEKVAHATGLPQIELDLINWQPGWYGLAESEPERFIAAVDAATAAPAWVLAGNYTKVVHLTWPRATDLVWLDLPKGQIMRQVIGRSLQRAFSGRDVFPGCRETVGRLFGAEHPIRYAFTTYTRRREQVTARLADPAHTHLRLHHCRTRADVTAALGRLAQSGPPAGQLPPRGRRRWQ